jgi:amino acid adenylation domain-containing protein
VSPGEIEDIYTCVHQQEDQMSATRSERFQIVLSVGPEIDMDRWCDALRRVVAVTPVMRTRLVRCRLGTLQVVIAGDHVTERLSGDLERYLGDDEARRLDFGLPLLRSSFIGRHFVVTIHHAIMDYWSLTNLIKDDVVHAYIGLPIPKRPPFKDFVAHCLSIDDTAARSFWSSRLSRSAAVFPRIEPGYVPYPSQKTTREIVLKRLGNGVSLPQLPSFAEAAWALTAATYADSDCVAYGFVLSGRSPGLNGAEAALGPTHCEVPVQASVLRTMTVEQLVSDRATSLRQLQAHAALQYGLLNIAEIDERTRAAAGFQTLLNIIPALPTALPVDAEQSTAIRFDRLVWRAHGSVALMLRCQIVHGGIRVEARHDPAILCERQLRRVLSQFEHTLQLLTEVPLQTRLDKLPLLSPPDHAEIVQWNRAIPETTEITSLHEMFAARARAQPDAVAVESSDGTTRYQELDRMSNRLARDLRRRGVSPGDSVALVVEKTVAAIVAALAILQAGGTCVPLDKDDSYDHNAAIISEVKARIILVSSAQISGFKDFAANVVEVGVESIIHLPQVTSPLEIDTTYHPGPAYIIPTSGATGLPKHVNLEHAGLVSTLLAICSRLGWRPGSRVLQYAPCVSNLSICEIFGTLLSGGCLCIPSRETTESTLPSFIESAKVSSALLPPNVLRSMSPSDVPSLKSVLSTGEPLDSGAVRTWGEALRFYNGWGASEASILSTIAKLDPDSPYPESIGTPVGSAVWVVNLSNPHELAPIGSVGELWIEGPGVARGYLNDGPKSSTALPSVTPPWAAAACSLEETRCFRSGDLGRYNPDGSLIFVGRLDNRVKLSGQTVQLEYIEGVLARCGGVKEIVTLTKIAAGRTQLVAVLSLDDLQLPETEVLQPLPSSAAGAAEQRLSAISLLAKSKLAANKIPTVWHIVQRLPRTAVGKVDRGAVRRWLKTLRCGNCS